MTYRLQEKGQRGHASCESGILMIEGEAMKRLTSFTFLILLGLCTILTAAAFWNRAEISEKENRSLQALPQLTLHAYLNGSFFRELEAYVYDHVLLRDQILEYTAVYDKIKGIEPEIMALEKGNNMNLVNPPKEVQEASAAPEKQEATDAGTEMESKTGETSLGVSALPLEQAEGGKPDFSEYKTQTQNLWIMAVKDTLMELFHFHEEKVQAYADALNIFAENMREKRLYSLLAPTQIGLTGDTYRDYSDPQGKAIEYAYSLLHERYETVDVFTPLYAEREQYLYFRSDHHWTQLGAYFAAEAFIKQAGLTMPALDEYEKKSLDNFLGYLYSNNQVSKVKQNPDRIDYYIYQGKNPEIRYFLYDDASGLLSYRKNVFSMQDMAKGASYAIFLGGDYPLMQYKNPEPTNDRVLMIVKDSYANALIPWLIHSFQKIIVIDPRTCQENIYTLAEQEGVTDFLVIDYVMALSLEGFISTLQTLAERH